MLTIAQRLAQAARYHQAGQFAQAEVIYRGVLQESPEHAQALHLLGVLAYQTGRPREAIDLIQRALASNGREPTFHNNLSAAYLAADLLPDAEAAAREALRLQPNLPDAHNNL